ncbi:reverse transcriptase domain, reverse transcriptase zinc-binding domain protein [Tanacetum coccineum]
MQNRLCAFLNVLRKYLGFTLRLPIGENIRKVGAWNTMMEKIDVRRSGWRKKGNGLIMFGVGNGNELEILEGGYALQESGDFTVRGLTKLVEEKIHNTDSGGGATTWNNLVPKKVNIFIWRDLKGRLPVREELDKRGVETRRGG